MNFSTLKTFTTSGHYASYENDLFSTVEETKRPSLVAVYSKHYWKTQKKLMAYFKLIITGNIIHKI